jgi:hypothetical protein
VLGKEQTAAKACSSQIDAYIDDLLADPPAPAASPPGPNLIAEAAAPAVSG